MPQLFEALLALHIIPHAAGVIVFSFHSKSDHNICILALEIDRNSSHVSFFTPFRIDEVNLHGAQWNALLLKFWKSHASVGKDEFLSMATIT